MPLPAPPPPPMLAPAGWNGNILPYYGWKAIVNLNTVISSGDGAAFSRIPTPIMGLVWYTLYPPHRDLAYGDVTPLFPIPDGTTRARASMNVQAYRNLVDKIWTDPQLEVWPFQYP